MATGFDPFASSLLSTPSATPDPTGVTDMLDVVRTVCGAQQASVVALDEDTSDVVQVMHHDGRIYAGHGEADGLPLAADIHDLMFEAGRGTSTRSPTSMILRLANRGRRRFYLLLRFQNDLARSRARAMQALPKLTQALSRLLDTETLRLTSERERTAATAALNQAQCGVIAATAEGRPVVVNEAAAAMMAREEWLHLRRGLIRPIHPGDVMRFQAALDTATPDGGQRDATVRPAAILLLRARNPKQQPIVVTISPAGPTTGMDEGRDRVGSWDRDRDGDGAAVIMHLAQPDLDAGHGLEPVCELLGLSRVETKLVQQLHRGSTLTEAAGTMRIKVDTARGYLKHIFSKTDTHRQTDLLALMTRHLRAVRGRFTFRPF